MAYFYLARYQQGTKSGWARAEILTELHFERYAVIYGRCIFLVFSLFSFFLFFFFAVGKKAHVRLFVFDWLNKSILNVSLVSYRVLFHRVHRFYLSVTQHSCLFLKKLHNTVLFLMIY